jgi:hypothetical protein
MLAYMQPGEQGRIGLSANILYQHSGFSFFKNRDDLV